VILFGLSGGIGNSLFCLPAIKALSRADKISLVVDGDYDMEMLWRRCAYTEKVYGPKSKLPKSDRYITGQYVPASFRGLPVEFCGWPRQTSVYDKPEWAQIKGKSCGDEQAEDVSDWTGYEKVSSDIDFAIIPCGKPGDEWSRKKWAGFYELACRLESDGHSVRAFGQADEIKDAGLQGWWDGPRRLEALPDALRRCRVSVANDSGIGHLACSLGIRTVMLFTATSPIKGRPLGPHRIVALRPPCSPCQSTPRWAACRDWRPCQEIGADGVYKEAVDFLKK
jgi:hypothetical protein